MNFPLPKKPSWHTTELAATLVAALPTFLTAFAGVIEGARDKARGVLELGLAVLLALLIGTVFKAIQARRKDRQEAARRSPQPLEAGLYVLHSAVLAMRGLSYEEPAIAKLRVTIFRVVDSQDVAVQVLPYVGGGTGEQGRRVSRRSGVIGRAILRGRLAVSVRDGSFDDYVGSLVRDYALPIEEARAVPDDRFAFLAVPLRDRRTNRVAGVVYMDSTDRAFLSHPEEPSDVISDAFVRRIARACTGLAAYAELTYPHEGQPQ
jgi:hypothetical protein